MTFSTSQKENILVCVNYGHNGKKLITRGASLAKQLDASLTILVFDSLPEEEFKNDKDVDMTLFKELANEYEAKLVLEKSHYHDITKVITNKAKEVDASQIIIGQFIESIWAKLIGGSIVNELLEKAPFADLHVVPRERSEETEDWNFERGVHAFLVDDGNGAYDLHFDDLEGQTFEGIFFKHLQTDFNSGIFALTKDGQLLEVRVDDGKVSDLTDIDDH
ncbi:universal stress protein [Shouchella sp. JSM 1781072]|uniref:universal stress protein n=1 Tax=Bacillaceae TaxID=186817 RepID=UPI0020D19607|nr:universal stress protein [Alkalihalobacillus sp. LMS6]UTR06537.1 universal stress protein [Alkalihalobacillus sp. LMS6]